MLQVMCYYMDIVAVMSETTYTTWDITADHVSQVMRYCLDIVAVIMSETTYTTWDITADHVSETMSVNN